jgi:hypothetical protein
MIYDEEDDMVSIDSTFTDSISSFDTNNVVQQQWMRHTLHVLDP